MIISKHAYQRSAERSGFNRKATDRIAERALNSGIPAEITRGQLRKWTDGIYSRSTNNLDSVMLYGDKAYLFDRDILITVLQIPSEYMKTLCNIRSKTLMSYS